LYTYNPTFIIHCGAYTKVDLAEDEPELCNAINTDSTGQLAQFAAEKDVPLIYYSTDYIFSGQEADKTLYPNGYPVDAPASPEGVYGKSKWEGELQVRNALGDHLIVRVAWLCGAHGANFVKTMIRLGSQRDQLNVVNDQFGSPSFVSDVVKTTELLLQKNISGTRHISSQGVLSWSEFATEIFAYSGLNVTVNPIPTSQYPTKARRPAYSKLDCSETIRDISLNMPFWKESLHKLIDEINSNS
jgi:dTDP-4-dehydrorhamnose reductase